jgi:hypothetical protein
VNTYYDRRRAEMKKRSDGDLGPGGEVHNCGILEDWAIFWEDDTYDFVVMNIPITSTSKDDAWHVL